MDPDLDQARRRAKELVRAARHGDPAALARLRPDRGPRLADAQRAVARELGFSSWPALAAHVEATQGDRPRRRARLVAAALGGREDVAERLLAHDPALARAGLDVALVLGDAAAVAAALDRDPDLVHREVPGTGRRPLSCACDSAFLRPSSPRAPGVRQVVALLLDHGAALDARDGDGLTPYARAARRGDLSLMALLERAGAPTDLDPVTDWLGALVRGDEERAARVLEAHPDLPSRLRAFDAELLPIMASAGEDAVVRRLLDAGLPLDARGVDDATALHYAGLWGRASTVALLLSRGAEVDLMGGPWDAPGTALDWTAWGSRALPGAADRLDGYLEATRALVAAGARVAPGMIAKAADEVAVVLEDGSPLAAARASWGERGEIELDTELAYARGRPVRVHVRKRGRRYELDDLGAAVAGAGTPAGWMAVAERIVAEEGLNVSRPGRVFVTVVEGRDLDALVRKVAGTSLALRAALLELDA